MFVTEHIYGLFSLVKIFRKEFRLVFGSRQKVRVKVIWRGGEKFQMNALRRKNWSLLYIYMNIDIRASKSELITCLIGCYKRVLLATIIIVH
jgi:hypothetical protein